MMNNGTNNKRIEKDTFVKALKDVKVPLLVLDEKWHHLFKGIKKSKEIMEWETTVDELLKLQGKLNTDLKNLKKVKQKLMSGIVNNMDDGSGENPSLRQKNMEDNKRLIDEVNVKLEEVEDELLDLPKTLDDANKQLMVYSMDACYKKLKHNAEEIEEIGTWIKRIRIELKKNIIIKQADEQKNEEIYSYMHDILGPRALDIFDLKYDDDGDVVE